MRKSKQLEIGEIFSNLTVIKHLGSVKYNNIYLCKCSCGNEKEFPLTLLRTGKATHCGCLKFSSNTHGNRKYSPQEASFRAKASGYKAEAKSRNIDYSLTVEDTINLLKGKCNYCLQEPNNIFNSRLSRISKNKNNFSSRHSTDYTIYYNGIDRVDNTKGYTIENTVSCCFRCNTAKLNYTTEDFKSWITNIYNNYIKNNE